MNFYIGVVRSFRITPLIRIYKGEQRNANFKKQRD